MLFKRFAELDFRGPTPKSSKVDSSASLFKWVLDRNAQQEVGTSRTSEVQCFR